MKKYTAEQVNAMIARLDGWHAADEAAAMLRDYAALLRERESEIPVSVEWHAEHGNFFDPVSYKGMGEEFFDKWFARRNEFPRR